MLLPEFDRSKHVHGTKAHVFEAPCNYDDILGRDVLSDVGLIMDFKYNAVKWMDLEISMKPREHWKDKDIYFLALADDLDMDDDLDDVNPAKYEKHTAKEIAVKQTHVSVFKKEKLTTVLAKHDALFNGELGHYSHEKVHLDLEPGSVPVQAKPHYVPLMQEIAFKTELQHLVDIGVPWPCKPVEWASPKFIIEKKDGRIRWISNLQELNKCLKCKAHHLPLIQDTSLSRKLISPLCVMLSSLIRNLKNYVLS
jgi:hypothetical protein